MIKTCKKTITVFLCLIMLFAVIGFGTFTASADYSIRGECGVNLTWNYDENLKILTIDGTGQMYTYNHYSYSYGYQNQAPWNNYDINKIIIGDGVTSISERAFELCNGYTEITIGTSVDKIGYSAFLCDDLIDFYYNARNAENIDLYAFIDIGRTSGGTNIIFGDEVEKIHSGVFRNVDANINYIKSVTFSDSVTSIDDRTFSCSGCGPEYVKMGNGLTSIPSQLIYKKNLKTFIIGNGITTIESSTFSGCNGLKSITIPDSVTNIGSSAFSNCTGLTSVTIGKGVTSIANNSFSGCVGLESINFNAENCSVGYGWLNGCTNLTTINIGDEVKTIPANIFSNCTGLTSITIPNSVTSIGYDAFNDCTGLTSVTIGNGVTSIDSSAFSGCTGLTSITIPDSVTSIGYAAFNNCPLEYVKMGSGLTEIPSTLINKDSLKTFIIGENVTKVGGFSDCKGLTNITFPGKVTSIYGLAFSGCTGLTSITIPNSVTSIGDSAFSGCTGLATITLPAGITKIGYDAFNNTAYYNNASNWSDNMLYIGNYLIKGKTDLAGNKSIKSGTTCIADSALYGCNKIITLTVPNSVKYIGSYAFFDVPNVAYTGTATGSPWGAKCLNGYVDGNFVYSDSGKAKLAACSGLASGSVVIPASTDTIGDDAFNGCTALTDVYIPVNVTRIGTTAFSRTALTDVYYEGSTVDKLGISFGEGNSKINDATWHYNSKVTDMPSNPTNPDNPSNPDNPNPPTPDISEANVIRGNSADNKKTYNYRTTVTFTANVPEGGSVQWYVDGKPAGTDKTLTVKDMKTNYTVKVVVIDKNGNQTMDEEQVTIKHSFFDILIWFFVHLFNPGAYDVKQ